MTIAEIESTLRTLAIRHPNLDDELLVTLLTAGGWESKVIKDALSLFKSNPNKYKQNIVQTQSPAQSEQGVVLNAVTINAQPVVPENVPIVPALSVVQVVQPISSDIVYYKSGGEEEAELPVVVDVDTPVERKEKVILQEEVRNVAPPNTQSEIIPEIDLTAPVEIPKDVPVTPVIAEVKHVAVPENVLVVNSPTAVSSEPQSLIVPLPLATPQHIDPPENLPLKPFESTPHVWPFSKYKEVFHGETMPVLQTEERALVNALTPTQAPEIKAPKKVKIKRTGFDGEDEGLIFLTATTLLIILLLLAYMYSNGRI
jgi:hypothetical protein